MFVLTSVFNAWNDEVDLLYNFNVIFSQIWKFKYKFSSLALVTELEKFSVTLGIFNNNQKWIPGERT